MDYKVISFSLWGDIHKYTIGAIKNAVLALDIYPGWICRYYVSDSVPINIIKELELFNHVEIVKMKDDGWGGLFWRFLATDADVMISRDTDSRLSLREKAAVDDWLASDKNFHIMRDAKDHTTKILGGMWGCRNILKDMKELVDSYPKKNDWYDDQHFLENIIYPMIRETAHIHDEFFDKIPFPTERVGDEFVGQIYDEFNKQL